MNSTQPTSTGPAGQPAAWTDAELADPHAREDKADRVRGMFAAIARSYDLNNRVHSLWRDQAWRRFAVRASGLREGDDVLDCACGTGDLTLAFASRGAGAVVGLDFTAEMLDLARHKTDRTGSHAQVRYVQGDAQELPFEDESFNVVSIAFGIRNVQNPGRAIAEFYRVLRPGGRLVILEFGRPGLAPVRWFNEFYCGRIMPMTATLISRDKSGAYRYLPKSVGTFMSIDALQGLLREHGFSDATSKPLSMGICHCTVARKPSASDAATG